MTGPRPDRTAPDRPSVMVVGPGWRFTSGMSYYTCRLANAFAERTDTSALLVRRLVPRALYPGRRRVGRPVNSLTYRPDVPVFEGIDWYWGRSIVTAVRFLRGRRPDVLVLQWWTGAVLHSYLLLAVLARRRGARVVVEWHEVQDTGEARVPGATAYVTRLLRLLLARCDGHVVHSAHDLALLRRAYHLTGPVEVAPHGPYDHLTIPSAAAPAGPDGGPAPRPGERTLLYFGIVRPYKGVEDLVAAFDLLPDDIAGGLRLDLAGETWEGWTAPRDAVRRSPRRDRITVIDRYVTDAEAAGLFAAADAVALPYRRSSSSGPLHLAMSAGLPVLVSDVGGLREAAGDYAGAVFTPPGDPASIAAGLVDLLSRTGRRYADPCSWSRTLDAYDRLLAASTPTAGPIAAASPRGRVAAR